MRCFMGIDAGTSGVKAVIIDEHGAVRGSGYHECDLIAPRPGWIEQAPEAWWSACCQAVRRAVSASGCGDAVAGIGLSGQMQGCLLMDQRMEPIGNCIIWLDQRAGREVEDIRELVSDRKALSHTANHCLNSFWAPKLLWIRKNRPEAYERAAKVLFAKDYLRYRMTGEVAAEVSDASLSFLMDVPNRCWSRTMFDKLNIDISLAPERLLESSDIAGYLRGEVAEDWGVPANIPVAAGGGDQPAGGVGTGIVKNGVLGSTIGTSGVIFGCTDRPLLDPQNRALMTMAHAVNNKWCFLGLELSAGGAFKWLRDTFFARERVEYAARGTDVYDLMTNYAQKAAPGCEGLIFLPYLNGEKTPISDENARGVFFGLSYRHGIQEICRSVMEGVTFGLRETIEICREMGQAVTEVRANGGGARSRLWLQMQADIYKAEIVTMNMEEGPAAGAAIMAAVAAGCFRNVEEGCEAWLRVVQRIEPDPKHAAVYDAYFSSYQALYRDLRSAFARQAQLVENG